MIFEREGESVFYQTVKAVRYEMTKPINTKVLRILVLLFI